MYGAYQLCTREVSLLSNTRTKQKENISAQCDPELVPDPDRGDDIWKIATRAAAEQMLNSVYEVVKLTALYPCKSTSFKAMEKNNFM